jgi:hypothetical protein
MFDAGQPAPTTASPGSVYLDPNSVLAATPGRAHDYQIIALVRETAGPRLGIINCCSAMQRGAGNVGSIWTTLDFPARAIKLKDNIIVLSRSLRHRQRLAGTRSDRETITFAPRDTAV